MPSDNLKFSAAVNLKGLTAAEVELKQKEYGFNIRKAKKQLSWFERLWDIFSEPMMLLLVVTAVVYFVVGEFVEGVIVFLSVIPIGLFEFFQSKRTDQAIRVLDTLVVEQCNVIRDGARRTIESKYVVPGDLLYLTAGDKIPADATVVLTPGLMVDEAIMTGESVPVGKSALIAGAAPTAEERLYQSTLVVQGEGYAVVTAIAGETEYGKLGNLMERIVGQKTPLQVKIEFLVKRLALVAIGIALFIGIFLSFKNGFTGGILGALTVAISIIPEEFPVVFSVFLIMGVWRLTKHNALVRSMVMVEVLGSATVICTDKTGTLTEGKMRLEKFFSSGQVWIADQIEQNQARLIIHDALLALEQNAVDSLEIEVQRFGAALGVDIENHFKAHALRKDSSFDAATKMVRHIWQGPDGAMHQYVAGAPEFVVERCLLSPSERAAILANYDQFARDGYRVIGVAKKQLDTADEFVEQELSFVALLAMSDPPRAGVKQALATCKQAGIKVIMITGDNSVTATAIAERIGLPVVGTVMSGRELDENKASLDQVVQNHTIFARVKPDQKYLLVEALQKNGEVVAMTGDGVNDAPALQRATIGIAMGLKGTEVARAAAGIVLLDDNFTTIVKAVAEGRRIYDNLRHAFLFLFTFHIPIIGLSLVPLFFNQNLYFIPVSIIFLELFCDPAVVIGFERDPGSRNLMTRPPRPVNEPLINPRLWKKIGWLGGGIFVASFGLYYYFGLRAGTEALGRTISYTALVYAQMFAIFLAREWVQIKGNKLLILIVATTVAVFNLVLFVPWIRDLFRFVSLSWQEYGVAVGTALLVMVLVRYLGARE